MCRGGERLVEDRTLCSDGSLRGQRLKDISPKNLLSIVLIIIIIVTVSIIIIICNNSRSSIRSSSSGVLPSLSSF